MFILLKLFPRQPLQLDSIVFPIRVPMAAFVPQRDASVQLVTVDNTVRFYQVRTLQQLIVSLVIQVQKFKNMQKCRKLVKSKQKRFKIYQILWIFKKALNMQEYEENI